MLLHHPILPSMASISSGQRQFVSPVCSANAAVDTSSFLQVPDGKRVFSILVVDSSPMPRFERKHLCPAALSSIALRHFAPTTCSSCHTVQAATNRAADLQR